MKKSLNINLISELFDYLKILKRRSDFVETIVIKSIKYELMKYENTLIIKSSNGKCLQLEFKKNVANLGYGEINYHTLEARYLFKNGTVLLITDGYRTKNLDNVVIGSSSGLAFISKDKEYHALTWDKDQEKLKYAYGFEKHNGEYVYVDGIDRYVISTDLQQILSINNKKLPSREEIKKFNIETEQEKINKLLKQNDLNALTKEMIIEMMKYLVTKSELVNKAVEGYDKIIPKCQKVLEEERFINQQVIESTFTKEELSIIMHILSNIIKNNTIENPKVLKKY